MPCILSIETSADACSISLWEDEWMVHREADEPRSHARMLAPMIDALLRDTGKALDGVCVDAGPGSYTGLRIGVSTAKGLAWSLDIPLYAVSTLGLVAAGAFEERLVTEGETVHVALGARGSELFVASYRVSNGYLNEEHAPRVCDSAIFLRDHAAGITVAGSEAVQHVLVETRDSIADSSSLDDHAPVAVVAPHSRYAPTLMRNPAATYRVEDVSSFEPRYMRAFEARNPAKSIFDRLPF